MWQILQTNTNDYTNHHPFFHTLFIKFCMHFGRLVIHSENGAVFMYSIVQIAIFAAIVGYSTYTLKSFGIKKLAILIIVVFFCLMPYHILFSISMWKDTLFSLFVLLFCVSVVRINYSINNQFINYVLLFNGGLGICIFRSNGIFAFFLFLIASFFILRKNKVLLISFCIIFTIGIFFRFPLMSMLDIKQPEFSENLSIPSQQVVRAYLDHKDIDIPYQEAINRLSILYNPENADPVKFNINSQFVKENIVDIAKFYISYGLRHPDSYFAAWIDQTVGYWNSGYLYDYWHDVIPENDFGIFRETHNESFNNIINSYFAIFDFEPFCIFRSTGFAFWVLLYFLYMAIVKKDKLSLLPIFINICIVATVFISTPIFDSFRYAYYLFCCLPFICCITMNTFERRVRQWKTIRSN